MTRLEDLLPANTEAEWTCGHRSGAVCAECYRILAEKAHELQMELDFWQAKAERLRADAGRLKA